MISFPLRSPLHSSKNGFFTAANAILSAKKYISIMASPQGIIWCVHLFTVNIVRRVINVTSLFKKHTYLLFLERPGTFQNRVAVLVHEQQFPISSRQPFSFSVSVPFCAPCLRNYKMGTIDLPLEIVFKVACTHLLPASLSSFLCITSRERE